MASLHKDPRGKSPFWYCAFYLPDGRRTLRSTKSRKHAEAIKICMGWEKAALSGREGTLTEAQIRRVCSDILENATGERPQFYTARGWLEEWLKDREGTAGGATMTRYRQVVRDFLEHLVERADLTVAAVSPADVRAFRDVLKKGGRTAATVNNVIKKVLNVPFAKAQRLGYIPLNPVAGVESLTKEKGVKRQPFDPAQISALLRASAGTDWEGLVYGGYFTGLRLGDLSGLRWESVDLDAALIRLQTAKTDTPVTVPIHPDFLEWLKKHRRGIGLASVFPKLAKCRINGAGGLSLQFRKLLDKAGIIPKATPRGGEAGRQRFDLSFHSLRHSFVTHLANAGIAPDIRKKLAGHAGDDIHLIYSHHDIDVLRGAVGAIPSIK